MSKTYELLEKIVTNEFKSQTLEANSNAYLAAYSFIIGVILLHIEDIFSSFKILFKAYDNIFYVIMGTLFALLLFMGIVLFISQCFRTRLPKTDKFYPNLEICTYEIEERNRLLAGEISHKQTHSEKIDVIISDIIRLRIIGKINEVTTELQKYNRVKRSYQQITGFCLLVTAFMGGQAIMNALPLRPNSAQLPPSQHMELPTPKPNVD